MSKKKPKAVHSHLVLLGNAKTKYPDKYDPTVLESFENRFEGQGYEVHLHCPEFTALCPKTGQPDFACIDILYKPRKKLVESKSLKIYLFSFRSEGSFHEDCVNKIARDLFNLMEPAWIEVKGNFMPRGGISINPTARITWSQQ